MTYINNRMGVPSYVIENCTSSFVNVLMIISNVFYVEANPSAEAVVFVGVFTAQFPTSVTSCCISVKGLVSVESPVPSCEKSLGLVK